MFNKIYETGLVDPLLKATYRKIPRLPRFLFTLQFQLLTSFSVRMADYAPAWGPRSSDGGFQFSEVLRYYKSPDVE